MTLHKVASLAGAVGRLPSALVPRPGYNDRMDTPELQCGWNAIAPPTALLSRRPRPYLFGRYAGTGNFRHRDPPAPPSGPQLRRPAATPGAALHRVAVYIASERCDILRRFFQVSAETPETLAGRAVTS
ncbi:hypothetical protein J4732_03770 [Serratia marcescens]|uniref:Uncharacterized protein n=1 Tax=Serratia marcescens TaxID=615 RepID=A0A939SQY9_SERMA|nr:hypothetical protein [Serratia marcescens]